MHGLWHRRIGKWKACGHLEIHEEMKDPGFKKKNATKKSRMCMCERERKDIGRKEGGEGGAGREKEGGNEGRMEGKGG